ncbi:hypothetical protein Sta7437_2858 [Stanieria cyanosphaera PCC 7437]|uniref:Uncharacterized protein n=2 Tax=Stanieria cyanosphaera TaxID=102116 RepID=K9XV09_STAC7|nr:hypothetical protein Sta7437_2858 [Stanieria cyanosphaera PCC 7437]
MKLFYLSSKFGTGIFILLFLLIKQCNQAQAVTFKFNNDFYNIESKYLGFLNDDQDFLPSLYLLNNQPKQEIFNLREQVAKINYTALETTQPKLINHLIASLKKIQIQPINNNDLSPNNIPILAQSEFNDIYKDVYDFDIDLVENNEKTGIIKNSINTIIKQKIPHYVASFSNYQPSVNLLQGSVDNSWTRISSRVPQLLTFNSNNNHTRLEFDSRTPVNAKLEFNRQGNIYQWSEQALEGRWAEFDSPLDKLRNEVIFDFRNFQANHLNQHLSINSNIITTSQTTLFATITPQQYQSAYSINLQNNYPKSDSLKKLDQLLEQEKKEFQQQQNRILRKLEQEQKNRLEKAKRKQEMRIKQKQNELRIAKKIQENRHKNLQKEIINQK